MSNRITPAETSENFSANSISLADELIVQPTIKPNINLNIGDLSFDQNGLIPTIIQQYDSKEVLMMAWMNAESLARTIQTGETWFWSRSRGELWHKGATSGNIQQVKSMLVDCDADCLLIEVDSAGVACHTGERSCFYRELSDG